MSHRWACDCCEHGSCVDQPTDCPSSTAFSFTQPEFDLTYSGASGASMQSTVTEGAVTCTNGAACFLDFRKADCSGGTIPACNDGNYSITTIPAILKKCDGTDCGGGDYSWEWNFGTTSGQNVGIGSVVVSDRSCGTRTYVPCVNTLVWVPQVTSVDLNPTGSGGEYWEYTLHWWLNLTNQIIGSNTTACGSLVDSCGRTGGFAWRDIMEPTSSFYWRTGLFTVRKENESCFRAEWNGATQEGSGTNVISITPPASGGLLTMTFGRKQTAASGSCSNSWNSCSSCPNSAHFLTDTSDTFYTSFGGTASWSLT